MEKEEDMKTQKDGIVNYFQGATINNLVINGNMTKSGTENFNTAQPDSMTEGEERGAGLPEALSTEEAMALWEKVLKAGYVDDHYQPLISRTLSALLADAMAKQLGISEKWKVFEALWNRKNMYRDYYKALNLQQSLDFQDEIKRLLR